MSDRVATVPCRNPWSTTEFEHHRACLPRDGVIEHRSFASPRTPPRRERVRSPRWPLGPALVALASKAQDEPGYDEPVAPTSPAGTDAPELLGPIIVPDTPSQRGSPRASIIVVHTSIESLAIVHRADFVARHDVQWQPRRGRLALGGPPTKSSCPSISRPPRRKPRPRREPAQRRVRRPRASRALPRHSGSENGSWGAGRRLRSCHASATGAR